MSSNSNSGAAPKPEKQTRPRTARVLDTTAIGGPRTHEMPVEGQARPFTFEPGIGLELPAAVAAKFLRHDGFRLVNDDNQIVPYRRQPKQPEELQAGETIKLAEHETIARFDELSSQALMQRALELPGGERFGGDDKPVRETLIKFLIDSAKAKREANKAAPDNGKDDFVPDAELEDA